MSPAVVSGVRVPIDTDSPSDLTAPSTTAAQSAFGRMATDIAEMIAARVASVNGRPPDPSGNVTVPAVGAIDAREYGVSAGGTSTDNLVSMQAAADAAADARMPLMLPPGDVWWSGEVVVTTDVVCRGRMVWSTDSPSRLTLRPSLAPTNLSPITTGPLMRGMHRITGYTGPAGTLEIQSSQVLILRDLGSAEPGQYLRRETVMIDRAGNLSPPLAHDYSAAQIHTLRVTPHEAPLRVQDLTVHTVGSVDATGGEQTRAIQVERSGVTFDRLTAVNTSGRELIACVQILGAAGVHFEAPVISGYNRAGSGYGININHSSWISLTDPVITDCRHGITVTNGHKVTIRGGTVAEPDAHWCDGMMLDGVTMTTTADRPVVSYTGSDLTLRDCHGIGGRTLVAIRGDSPEVHGRIIVDGGTWAPNTAATAWVVGGTSYNYSTVFDYGRTLAQPDVHVTGLLIDPAGSPNTPSRVEVVSFTPRQYARTQSDITITDVQIRGVAETFGIFYDCDAGGTRVGVAPRLTVRRCRDLTRTIYLHTTTEGTPGQAHVTIDDAGEVRTQLNEWATRGGSVVIRDSTIREHVRIGITTPLPDQTGQPTHVFQHCTFRNPAFNGNWMALLHGTEWVGAVANTNLGVDGRVRAITGGILRRIGATGAPTHPDGYANPAYYQA